MKKNSSLLDPIRGKTMQQYINRLLALGTNFSVRFDSPFIYSQDTLDVLAKYYFNSFIYPNKIKTFPTIDRVKKEETPYEYSVPFNMTAGTVFIKAGDLMRDLMIEKNIKCTNEYYEILPMLVERLTYEHLAQKLNEPELKLQGLAYQINRARKAAIELDIATECKKDYDPKLQKVAKHSRMIIVSTAFSSAIDTKKINEDFSANIRKIIAGKETVDDLVKEYKLSCEDDYRIEMAIAHQIQTLKMNISHFR